MSNERPVGEIVYQVSMDVQKLLTTYKQVDNRLDSLEGRFNKTTKSINGTEKSIFSLSNVAKSLAGYLSASAVAGYADAWTSLNNKLVNAVRVNEDLLSVTERVFNLAQETRSGLDATASLYARLERATRAYGTSVADVAKLTRIINQGFIVSGATTHEATNAIIQLSHGLAAGTLQGTEFNSVNEQGNRLIIALADSLGVTTSKLKEMASQGKLTTDVVVKGLLKQGNTIGKEFAKTVPTLSQSLEQAGNNMTKFFGESATVQTGIHIFSDAVISLSGNLSLLTTALTAAAAVMGSRYVGALYLSTENKIKNAAASFKQETATYRAAQAAKLEAQQQLATAKAERERIFTLNEYLEKQSAVNRQHGLNISYQKEFIANDKRLEEVNKKIIASRQQLTIATKQASVATRALAVSTNMLRGGLALIGGPAGAAMLAAGAIYYLWNQMQEAKQQARDFSNDIPDLIKNLNQLNLTQLNASSAKTSQNIRQLKEDISDYKDEIASLQKEVKLSGDRKSVAKTDMARNTAIENERKATEQLAIKKGELDKAITKLSLAQDTYVKINKAVTDETIKQMKAARDSYNELSNAKPKIQFLSDAQDFFAKKIGVSTENLKKFNQEMLMTPVSKEGNKLLEQIKNENELLKIQDKKKRFIESIKQAARGEGVEDNSGQMYLIEREAKAQWELKQAEEARNNNLKSSQKLMSEASDAIARQREELERLNTGFKEGSLEMAKYDAVRQLGLNATENQIQKAKELAASIYEIQKAEENRKNAAKGQDFATDLINKSKSELEQIDIDMQEKRQKIDEYLAIDLEHRQLYEDAKTAIEQEAANKRKAIFDDEQRERMNAITSMLGAASQGFDGIAGIIQAASGKQAAAYKVMFALSKGFAVAQAAISLQVNLAKAMELGYPQNLPAMAAAAGQGASLLSTIGSISYGGGRYGGGGVEEDKFYRFGENGKPEIMVADSGRQYLLPGEGGRIIPNKDLGSGSGQVNFHQENHFNITTTNGIDNESMRKLTDMMKKVALSMIKDQKRPGGLLSK
ncbi:tape measure protein [Arsenophonus sp. aPb]|uniref:tape measure protein n=1 Tax=Arsenophonus sp. aPb TaxID=3041619 RepID=UPI0024687DA0|nr:tape measure protein [Arsenophonus sp. aPb]WGL99179.1 tape measure protein [Arsenophonus sp. aPb]